MIPLLILLVAFKNFRTRLAARLDYDFLKIFAFSGGASWIVLSLFRKALALFPFLVFKPRDLKVFHNSLGFYTAQKM